MSAPHSDRRILEALFVNTSALMLVVESNDVPDQRALQIMPIMHGTLNAYIKVIAKQLGSTEYLDAGIYRRAKAVLKEMEEELVA